MMQEFFKQQAEWLNAWQEQQKKLNKQYANWGEELAKGFPGSAAQQIPTNFEELLKAQQELFEQFTSFGASLQQNIQQTWGDKLPAEMLRQLNFNVLQEFYKNWLGSMPFPSGLQNPFMGSQNWFDPSRFFSDFMNQEHPFFSTFSSDNMTDGLQKMLGMLGLLQGSKLPGGDLYSQLFTNFQSLFNQLSSTTTSQGFEKLLETFGTWKEQTDKYLLAPQVGINRETAQDVAKAVSLSFDYIQSFAKMGKLIEETARKAGNRFQAKLVERSLNNEAPIKFSDFCDLWTKENEAVFLAVFGSEDYAKIQGEFSAAGFRLKIQINKLVEKVLDQTPIALKRDVDLAAKEILQLKRDLRQSRKQQQDLAAEAKDAKQSAEASEKRSKQLEASLAAEAKVAKQAAEASEKRFKQLEASLAKVQVLAEKAEHSAKSAIAKQSKEAAPAKSVKAPKAPVEAAKKAPVAKAKKAPVAKANKATSGAKKPAGNPVK